MKSEPKNKIEENAPAAGVPASPAAPAEASLMEGELGEIKIHEDVLANLVSMATLKVPGVSRLAGSTVVDAIASIVGSRRMQARAIAIGIAGDNRVTVDLKLNILAGFRLPDVVQQVQRAVIDSIEEVTGMTVTRVNVAVQDIDEQPVEDDEEGEDKGNTDGAAIPPAAIPPMP